MQKAQPFGVNLTKKHLPAENRGEIGPPQDEQPERKDEEDEGHRKPREILAQQMRERCHHEVGDHPRGRQSPNDGEEQAYQQAKGVKRGSGKPE